MIELFTRPGSPALRRFLISIAVVGAACAALIHHDPWRFLLFFYLPWCVVYFLAPLANWYQHHRCAFTDPYTSANINLSVLCSALGFNIGYHSAHHLKPTLHWSQLATYHWTRVAPRVPERYYWPIPLAKFRRRQNLATVRAEPSPRAK